MISGALDASFLIFAIPATCPSEYFVIPTPEESVKIIFCADPSLPLWMTIGGALDDN